MSTVTILSRIKRRATWRSEAWLRGARNIEPWLPFGRVVYLSKVSQIYPTYLGVNGREGGRDSAGRSFEYRVLCSVPFRSVLFFVLSVFHKVSVFLHVGHEIDWRDPARSCAETFKAWMVMILAPGSVIALGKWVRRGVLVEPKLGVDGAWSNLNILGSIVAENHEAGNVACRGMAC